MKTLERIDQHKQLWQALLPFCPAPDDHQMAIWLRQFADDELEHGYNRARVKFGPHRGPCPEAEIVHRYITGVLVNSRRE